MVGRWTSPPGQEITWDEIGMRSLSVFEEADSARSPGPPSGRHRVDAGICPAPAPRRNPRNRPHSVIDVLVSEHGRSFSSCWHPTLAVSLHVYGVDLRIHGSSVRCTYDLPVLEASR
jgi:hypothetical protein